MTGSVGRCLVCCRNRLAAGCEDRERIVKALRERQPGQHYQPKPERAAVCKDCCIGALDGHGCPWWNFCWEEWTVWSEALGAAATVQRARQLSRR